MTDEVHGLILSDPADEHELASLMGRLEPAHERPWAKRRGNGTGLYVRT